MLTNFPALLIMLTSDIPCPSRISATFWQLIILSRRTDKSETCAKIKTFIIDKLHRATKCAVPLDTVETL